MNEKYNELVLNSIGNEPIEITNVRYCANKFDINKQKHSDTVEDIAKAMISMPLENNSPRIGM